MRSLWENFLYEPLYNTLIALTHVVPWGDVGIAVVILTILVKLLLYPLSHKSVRTQVEMKRLEPELEALKRKHGDDREALAKKTMELYRERKVNPFSGCLLILIQFPVIIALYFVFLKGIGADEGALYSFVALPDPLNTNFLGLVDLHAKSAVLAVLAVLAQFWQSSLMAQAAKPRDPNKPPSFQEEFARSMNLQMKYVIPIIIGFVSYATSAAVALYFVTSSVFGAIERIVVERRMRSLKSS